MEYLNVWEVGEIWRRSCEVGAKLSRQKGSECFTIDGM